MSNRSIVVTGAARGIGEAVVRRLVAQDDHVIAVDLDPKVADLADGLGSGRVTPLAFDVTDPDAWSQHLAPIRQGGVHIGGLVACAGILGEARTVQDTPAEDFRRVIEVNLTGVFVSNQAVVGDLRDAGGGGRIVNIASIAGKEGNAGQAGYSASKGGVIALTKSLAKELAGEDITVNCIAPTVVEGPFSEAMSTEMRDAIKAKIPMNRFAAADEVAALAAWICSPDCSFTTGFCFDLTGGRATY